MNSLKLAFCAVLIFTVQINYAQSEQQIRNELEKRGIDTIEEVQVELRKRGMSEADARRQAQVYGIDYDEYLRQYILGNSPTTKQTYGTASVDIIEANPVDYVADIKDEMVQEAPTITADPKPSGLSYYGYNVFNSNPFANQQALVSNIDPGYIIGPGDELRIYLWGDAEFQYQGQVDINGNLFIPNVGQVFVAGTSYESLNQRLKQFLSKFYSGLADNPPAIFLDVSLTKLRPIRIMVLGESNNPGSHLINAFATTINSLYVSGGIKTSGSLREIRVFRNSKSISTIDFYDYLTKGTVAEDIRLVSNDVIFIKPRLNSISINGAVRNPAIYELKEGEGLNDLITFAGGLRPNAYTETVTIKRIKSLQERNTNNAFDREIITVNYNKLLAEGTNLPLQDGDEIEFSSVLDKVDNVVSISGSVFRPGDYQLRDNLTLFDLVGLAGGTQPRTYFEKVDLFRKQRNGTLEFMSYSLDEILNNGLKVNLLPDDSVKVYNLDELKAVEFVSIEGFLSEPKSVLWRENLTIYDLIFMSANIEDLDYKNQILTSRADLLRYQEGKTEYLNIPFNLDQVLNKEDNFELKPKDKIILYSRSVTEELETSVSIVGAVRNTGRFALTDSMTIEDLIIQAGGFRRTSFRDSVTISTENFDFSGNEIATVRRVKVDLDYLTGNTDKNPSSYYLKNNDNVSVDFIPGSGDQRQVTISGEVKFPGRYFLTSKGEKLSELIERAGGFSPNVYLPASTFYRGEQLLAMSFEDLFEKNNRSFDIVLQNGDRVVFAESRYTVSIQGAVENPSLQKFNEDQRVRKYLRNSGGKIKDGDNIFLTSPNGFTRKIGFLRNPKVLDGSSIRVALKPPKEEKPPRESNALEVIATLAGIITSSLTTIFIVQRLN